MRFDLAKYGILSFTEFGSADFGEVLATYQYLGASVKKDNENKMELYTSAIKAVGASVGSTVAKLLRGR